MATRVSLDVVKRVHAVRSLETRAVRSNKGVLILGAGSAGLNAALELRKAYSIAPDPEITLVDQHNYHLFPPLLFQVATGGLEPGHICFPIRSLLRGEPTI